MSIVLNSQDSGCQYLKLSLDVNIKAKSSFQAKVSAIIDGDTIEIDLTPESQIRFAGSGATALVQISTLSDRVRLLGIDALEMHAGEHANQQCELLGVDFNRLVTLARISSIHLQGLCPKGAKVSLRTTSQVRDNWNRILCGVFAGDVCVNRSMVEQGYALAYQGESDWEDYRALEAEARAAGRGIWGECAEAFYPATTTTKTYHRPGCSNAPKSGARFSSIKDAKAKGFKPCSACIPDFK